MTHIPSRSELRALMEQQADPCISLFLPTGRADIQQNPLRLSNLMREAEYHLLLNNLSVPQVEALLEPARGLLENEPFWLHPDDGLAVFRSPDLFRTYWLPGRFKEQAVVTRHFYLKPLLPFLADNGRFYLLALSHNHIRPIEATRCEAREANTYPHLQQEGVPGTPDRVSLETLHRPTWTIAGPSFLQVRQEAAARYREYAATGRAFHTLRESVPAACDGRVESLFIEAEQEQWGIFNPATRKLHIHPQARFNDDDLLDVAATQTLLHGGSVYVVERADMPGEGPLAALLRY